jgi:hypothetical protein
MYELGLTFAPANSDALLALGDLYRDNSGYEAARRQYELLQRNGGSAATTARQRLATLPSQAPPTNRGEPPAPETTTSRAPIDTSAPHATGREESHQRFDGLYAGTSQVLGYSSPNCVTGAVRVEVRNGKLSFARNRQAVVANDGTFNGTNPIGLPPVVQFWVGKIAGDSMEIDISDPACKYHITLKKVS